jgi:hypothetical protein
VLKWLGRNLGLTTRSTHPLATAESVAQVLAELPSANTARALQEIGDWLALTDRADLSLGPRVAAIRRLDEAAQPLRTELWLEYLGCPPAHHRAEQTWFALTSYAQHLYGALIRVLREHYLPGRDQAGDTGTSALLAARAMAALMERKRLLRMRYRAVEPALWSDAFELYQAAVQQGIARRPLRLYPEHGAGRSLHAEFLAGMLFETAPVSGLNPVQMEYLDRVVHEFAGKFSFRESFDESTPFVIDYARAQGPQRCGGRLEPRMSQRFIGPGMSLHALITLIKDLRRTRELPPWLAIEGRPAVQECVNLLEKLMLHWSRNPPRRLHERQPLRQPLDVVHGYREIRRMIAGVHFLQRTAGGQGDELTREEREELSRFGYVSERRDPAQLAEQERSRVRDMIDQQNRLLIQPFEMTDHSEFGLGALGAGQTGWLRVGMLLGLRWGAGEQWAAGVARRIARNAHNQVQLGVQLFPGSPECGRIGALDQRQVSVFERAHDPGVSVYFDAILLAEDNSVLVEPGVHVDNGRFRLVVAGRRSTIRFTQLLERGDDFELVRFETLPD